MVPGAGELSPQFQQHLQRPCNPGRVDQPDGEAHAQNPACGDELCISLKVRDSSIHEARFQASGCAATLAAGSMVTSLLTGCRLDDAQQNIGAEAIELALGGLGLHRRHAAQLASETALRAIQSALDRTSAS